MAGDPVINGDNRIRTLAGSSIYRSCAQDGPETSMGHGGVTCSFVPGIWQDRMAGAAQREIFTLPVDAARLKARAERLPANRRELAAAFRRED